MFYTGIGSRSTPLPVLMAMESFATQAARYGMILRSGAAAGADAAFEKGCDAVSGSKEIYLPWKGFNKHLSTFDTPSSAAELLAIEIHPNFSKLSDAASKLLSRNMHQVLGFKLTQPSEFVICWTPDGCEHYSAYSHTTGGTGSAIALASHQDIPVFNLFNPNRLYDAYQALISWATAE